MRVLPRLCCVWCVHRLSHSWPAPHDLHSGVPPEAAARRRSHPGMVRSVCAHGVSCKVLCVLKHRLWARGVSCTVLCVLKHRLRAMCMCMCMSMSMSMSMLRRAVRLSGVSDRDRFVSGWVSSRVSGSGWLSVRCMVPHGRKRGPDALFIQMLHVVLLS